MQSSRIQLLTWGLLVAALLSSSSAQLSDSVMVEIEQDVSEVVEGDSGTVTNVFIDVYIVANTLQSPAPVSLALQANATYFSDFLISACSDLTFSGFGSGSGFGSTSGSGIGSSGSGSRFGSGFGSGFEPGFEMGGGGPGDIMMDPIIPIPPGIVGRVLCINVTIIGDNVPENTETVNITFVRQDERITFVGDSDDSYEALINIIDNDGVTLSVSDMLNVTEGERQEICVTLDDFSSFRERDVVAEFRVYQTGSSMMENDVTFTMPSVVIPPGMFMACTFIVVNNDSVVEPTEIRNVTVVPLNQNDVIVGSTSLVIIDNDGVMVQVPATVEILEGQVGQLCAQINNTDVIVEREVGLTLTVPPNVTDIEAINTSIAILPGFTEACFYIRAIDDDIVEPHDQIPVMVMALDRNDRVIGGPTTIVVIDDDMVELDVLDDVVTVNEGQTTMICVNVTNRQQIRERQVTPMFTVDVGSNFTEKGVDFMINNQSFFITPDMSEACLDFETFDDDTVENDEMVTVMIMAEGEMVGSTRVVIIDNDGVRISPVNDTLNVTEGDEFTVCVRTINVSELQRDINLTFYVNPNSIYARGNDLMITSDPTIIIPAMSMNSLWCISLQAVDDLIVEGTELFNVSAMPANPLDIVSGVVSVSIADNDGVNITLPMSMNLTEGDTVNVCAYIMPATRERELYLTFNLTTMNAFAGENDLRIINGSMVVVPPQVGSVCVTLEAPEDMIFEETETFYVTVQSNNTLDQVIGSTRVSVIDNDVVNLMVTENITLMEGLERMLCVQLAEGTQTPERNIEIDFVGAFGTMYTDNRDYQLSNRSAVIYVGDRMVCITLLAVEDDLIEDEETFTVLTSSDNSFVNIVGNTSVTIIDNDGAVINFQNAMLTVNEMDPSNFMICVELSSGTSLLQRPVALSVIFESDSADIFSDILLLSMSDQINSTFELEFVPNGENVSCFHFNVNDDDIIENTEMFRGLLRPRLVEIDQSMTDSITVSIMDNDGATVRLTDTAVVSLVEGESTQICVALEDQIELLDRTVNITIISNEESRKGEATSSLEHSDYIVFNPGGGTVMCTSLSIDVDLIYSMDRSFVVKFMLMNERDTFSGTNEITVNIIENGLRFLAIADLEGIKTVTLGTDPEDPSDGFSDPIYFRGGFPVGTSTRTLAHVGDNGVISFDRGFLFFEPSQFPTNDPAIQNSSVVSPFWADSDIRRTGDIRYVLLEAGSSTGSMEMALLNFISGLIAAKLPERAGNFSATSMLVAQWMNVPPYPHGTDNELSPDEAEFVSRRNSFQGVVVTDGEQSFAVFTYNCNQLQWSGQFEHAVIGVNLGLGSDSEDVPRFQTHPLSGNPEITMVACANQDNGVQWSDLIYKIGDAQSDELQRNRSVCQAKYLQDIQAYGNISEFSSLFVRPCPCSIFQAVRDRRFRINPISGRSSLCFVERFFSLAINECCYSLQADITFGALLGQSEDGEGGSVILSNPRFFPQEYLTIDRGLRTSCCRDADLCDLYYERRPPSIDSCRFYRPPRRAWFWGDPHITSLDGRLYTFNGLGEYTLARIYSMNESAREFELQGRTVLVNGSNATQFSAFAFGLPLTSVVEVRIIKENRLEVLLNGTILDQLSPNASHTDPNVDIEITEVGAIETSFSNGISITVSQQSGILDIVTSFPQSFIQRPVGLLGNFNGNDTDDFIYANGTMLENDASDRMIHYFAQTWEITADTSLFTYPYGLSAANFSFPDHMPRFLDEVVANASPEIVALCGDNAECIFDATETGDTNIGIESRNTNQENSNDQMIISNLPPRVEGDSVFFITVGEVSVYTFTVMDDSGEPTVIIENDLPSSANLTADGNGLYRISWVFNAAALPTFNRTLRIIARDGLNATTLLVPQLQICACNNMGGNCTLEGLIDTAANPLTLNCECSLAYTGRFCFEDDNGCEELSCFMGVECTDVAAPGVGATCGQCPSGFIGDGVKCLDINECADNSTNNCQQICMNTEGSFECQCFPGHEPEPTSTTDCRDINECLTLNGGCHQVCDNEVGNFSCSCLDGYELDTDGITCVVLANRTCQNASICEQNCAVVNNTDTCSCDLGFELAGDMQSCPDVNECDSTVCEQRCNNTEGSFFCSCDSGFNLAADGRMCMDINECIEAGLADENLCSGVMMCTNTIGSFMCVCPPGTELYNGTCREVCGMNFYRLSNNRCSACPEYSIRPLNQSESMCTCMSGYMRRMPMDVGQPCLPTIGFATNTVTFPEQDVSHQVVIPLKLSAYSRRDISLTFTVNPSTYMSLIANPTVVTAQTTMQNLTLTIAGNDVPTDGDVLFSITIVEGNEFLLPSSEGISQYYMRVEITIEEDDELTSDLESNSLLVTLGGYTVETFTAEVEQRFKTATANAINQYCQSQTCTPVSVSKRKRQESTEVTADDIILRDLTNSAQGQLQFSMFVLTDSQLVLAPQTVEDAIEASPNEFFSMVSLALLAPPTTSPSLSPSPVDDLSAGAIVGIVIAAIAVAILLFFIIVLIIILVRRKVKSKSFVLPTSYGFPFRDQPKGSSLRSLDREADENIYTSDPADAPLTGEDDEKEKTVSVQLTSLSEREDEQEIEVFSNKAAEEPTQEMSLSDDIAQGLSQEIAKSLNEETQIVEISFDEPGEETKL